MNRPKGHDRKRLQKAARNGIALSRDDADGLHSDLTTRDNLPYWEEQREHAYKESSEESIPRFQLCDACVRRILLNTSTEFVEGEPSELLGNILHEASGLPAEE